MKKLLLPLFAACLFTAGAASAQTTTAPSAAPADQRSRPQVSPEERATRQSQRLSQELGLSADQTSRIQQIMLSREQEMQAMRGQGAQAGTREQMGEQIQANRAKYDAQFKGVLTADQYTKFTAMEDKRRQRGPGMRSADGNPDKLKMKEGKIKAKDGKKGKLKAKTTES